MSMAADLVMCLLSGLIEVETVRRCMAFTITFFIVLYVHVRINRNRYKIALRHTIIRAQSETCSS